MYTLLFHKPEHIQMLMRPVRPPSRSPSNMCPSELLSALTSFPASLQGLFWNLWQRYKNHERLEAAGKTCLHLLIWFNDYRGASMLSFKRDYTVELNNWEKTFICSSFLGGKKNEENMKRAIVREATMITFKLIAHLIIWFFNRQQQRFCSLCKYLAV